MRTLKVSFGLINLDSKQKLKLKTYLDEAHTLFAPYFKIYYSFEKKDFINAIHGDLSVVIYSGEKPQEKVDIFLIEFFGFERLLGELEYLFLDIKKYLLGEIPISKDDKHKMKKYFYYFHDSLNPITSVGEV